MTLEAVPSDGSDDGPGWRRRISVMVNQLLIGGGDNVSTVTVQSGTTTTAITDYRIGPTAKVVLIPESSAAAALIFNGSTYVTAVQNELATIYHASQGSDITLGYVVAGS
jgi:hypothetical protein